jgi:hypothetical protein
MRRKKNFVCDLGAFGGEDKPYRRRLDVERTRPISDARSVSDLCGCVGANFLAFETGHRQPGGYIRKMPEEMIARLLF